MRASPCHRKTPARSAGIVRGEKIADRARVVREERDRRLDAASAQPAGERRRVHVADVQRADDQVVAAVVGRARERLGAGGDARQRRRVAQVEVEELAEDELVQLAVLSEGERIVQARDEQDLLNAELREIQALDQPLIHHRIGDLEEAGDVRAVDVVAGVPNCPAVSQHALWIAFMMRCSRSSTSSRDQLRRMLFCDISRPDVATPPALAALPGP